MTRSQTLSLRMGVRNYAHGLVTAESQQGLYGDVLHLTGAPVPVSTNFEYASFDANAGTQLVDTKIGDHDPEGPEISYGGSLTEASLITNGASTKWYPVGSSVSDEDVLLSLNEGAMMGTNRMLLSRLSAAFTAIDVSAQTDTIDSTNAALDMVELIQENIEAVEKAAGGYCNVHLLWGPRAFRAIASHAKVQSRLTGNSGKGNSSTLPVNASLAQMDELLGYGTASRRTRAVYNSAAQGQTVDNAYLLTNAIYIAAVSRTPNRIDPAAVKLFQGRNGDGNLMSPIYYKHASGTHERAKWEWREKVAVTNAAAIYKVTITV